MFDDCDCIFINDNILFRIIHGKIFSRNFFFFSVSTILRTHKDVFGVTGGKCTYFFKIA